MSNQVRVRDTQALQKLIWVSPLAAGHASNWGVPNLTNDFERVTTHVVSFPSYNQDGGFAYLTTTVNDKRGIPESLQFTPPIPPIDTDSSKHHQSLEDNGLCLNCEDVDIKGLFGLGRRKYPLGYFDAIASCSCCPLCRLMVSAVEGMTGTDARMLNSSYAGLYCILTSISTTVPMGSRQNRPFDLLVYLFEERRRIYVGGAHIRLLSEDAHRVEKTRAFYGREVPHAGVDMGLVKAWLDECNMCHGCYNEPHDTMGQGDSSFFLIDVHHFCVVKASRNARYIALSYVWPRAESRQLTMSNMDALQLPGALLHLEPCLLAVIHDSMALVSSIGETYLWVDALCIVQDDVQQKQDLIDSMDAVYGSSYLTIIAAGIPDANHGLPGLQPDSRSVHQHKETIAGLRFVSALPDYGTTVGRSKWSSRGWTFQEGILSKRCLIFTTEQVYFRCVVDSRCEDVVAESAANFEAHPAKPRDRDYNLGYFFHVGFKENPSALKAFDEYALLAKHYTARHLTYESDIINAFSGIMKALGPYFGNPGFCYGLPERDFDRAILWYPTSHASQRKAQISGSTTVALPSWSWTGWSGSVDYEEDILEPRDASKLRSAIVWYKNTDAGLARIASRYESSPEPEFSLAMLYSQYLRFRHDSVLLTFWATTFQMRVSSGETHIYEWLSDSNQSVPCFTLLDASGHPCGMLPSVDRDWASKRRQYPESRSCELLILSISMQSDSDDTRVRREFYHEKYAIGENKRFSFLNVMLVEYDSRGMAHRLGVGKVHFDAVNERDFNRRVMVLG